MNIVFCFRNNSQNDVLENLVIKKLKELQCQNPGIEGAQVNFSRADGSGDARVCVITLSQYGKSVSVCKAAASYERAANDALAELARKIQADGNAGLQSTLRREKPVEGK